MTTTPSRQAQSVSRPSLAGRRVLLIEDDHVASKFYELVFTRAGAVVLQAADSAAARRVLAQEKTDGRVIHLVVLDFSLPDGDGAALATALRADGFAGAIAGLTAGVAESDARRWRGGGCDVILPKALSSTAVISRLAALAGRPTGYAGR